MSNGNIQNYLNAEELHLHKLFSDVRGFYIPEYQRPYTWKKEDIDRLFESIKTSLKQMNKADYPTFLGAILAITPDMELQNAYNINQAEGPGIVHILIDGQQRITSLILIIAELYKDFSLIKQTLEKKNLRKNFAPLQGLLNSSLSRTKGALFTKNDFIEDGIINEKAFLPKIIYGITNDSWKKSEIGIYNHVISRYLYELSVDPTYCINDESSVVEIIEKIIDSITEYNEDFQTELLKELLINKEFQQRSSISQTVINEFQSILDSSNEELKLISTDFLGKHILLEFILTKVIFAHIRVDKESFAFDIFDSLNSTGDSLTAFETFKPSVIKFFNENPNLGKYEDSTEKKYLDKFTSYLSEKNREDRHTITKQFITSLIYYYSGDSVIEATNEQRKKLRNIYETIVERDKKNEFIKSFEILTDFLNEIWEKDPKQLTGAISDNAKIALAIFSKIKHTITVPILAHYYRHLIYKKSSPDYKEFSAIVEGVFTYSLFWRLLNGGGTAGIDDEFRNFIKELSFLNNSEPFSKEKLFILLRKSLNALIGNNKKLDKINFSLKVSDIQYSTSYSNVWIKFFLLASNHDSIPDKKTGLDKRGAGNCNKVLTIDNWIDYLNPLTIEHIVPQSPKKSEDWINELYLPSYLHNIGNLVPMPKKQNGVLGNRKWEDKKIILRIVSLSDLEERKDRLKDIEKEFDLKFSKKAKDNLENSQYFRSLESLTNVDEWTPDFVKKRAKRIAELAWDNIAPWLGY